MMRSRSGVPLSGTRQRHTFTANDASVEPLIAPDGGSVGLEVLKGEEGSRTDSGGLRGGVHRVHYPPEREAALCFDLRTYCLAVSGPEEEVAS